MMTATTTRIMFFTAMDAMTISNTMTRIIIVVPANTRYLLRRHSFQQNIGFAWIRVVVPADAPPCLRRVGVVSTTATAMGRMDSSRKLVTPITVAIREVVGAVAFQSWTISSTVNGKALGNSTDVRSQPMGCCSSSVVVAAFPSPITLAVNNLTGSAL